MEGKKQNRLMIALIAVVAVLALLVVYAFAVRPAISGYVTKAYNTGVQDGVSYAVSTVMQQAAQCNPSGVPLTYQNQTLRVFAIECTQQAPQVNQGNTNSS